MIVMRNVKRFKFISLFYVLLKLQTFIRIQQHCSVNEFNITIFILAYVSIFNTVAPVVSENCI